MSELERQAEPVALYPLIIQEDFGVAGYALVAISLPEAWNRTRWLLWLAFLNYALLLIKQYNSWRYLWHKQSEGASHS